MLAGLGLTHVTIDAAGRAPARVAWQGYHDLDRWSTWSPQIRGVEAAGRTLRAGLTGHVRGPAGLRVGFTVLDVDELHLRWSWKAGAGPVEVRLDHGIDETPGGCRAWLVVHAPPFVVAPYLPLAWYALHRLVNP